MVVNCTCANAHSGVISFVPCTGQEELVNLKQSTCWCAIMAFALVETPVEAIIWKLFGIVSHDVHVLWHTCGVMDRIDLLCVHVSTLLSLQAAIDGLISLSRERSLSKLTRSSGLTVSFLI